MNSILTSVKKLLGIAEECEDFDADIVMYLNSVFMVLTQMGVGPKEGFAITGKEELWNQFITDPVTAAESGRARWMPDGRLAFVGVDEQGVAGVFAQEVVAGVDTTATRHRLGGFDPTLPAESFAISPDGAFLTVAARESLASVALAEPVEGAGRPRRR